MTVTEYENGSADVVFKLKKETKRVIPEEKSADLTDLKKDETQIVTSGAGYEASVKWSSSAAESTNWTYSCEFNGEYLDSTNGRCVDSIYDENGNESATICYANGCAHFRLNGKGNLIWEELRDNYNNRHEAFITSCLSVQNHFRINLSPPL